MKLIVGLGNPGSEYNLTRHNIGFLIIDAMNESHGGGSAFKKEKKSLVCQVNIDGENVLLVKPQTYMNLSGEAVQALMAYYKVELSDLLVIHDDLDQSFLNFKFQQSRGAGGHNGIKDIHQKLGSPDYARLKIGVGRPSGKQLASSYVLKPFNKEELASLQEHLINDLEDAVVAFVKKGYTYASNHFNQRRT